jgi:Ras-related protein Rab-1A
MAPLKDYDYLFKIVIIGDSGVGKSSLLLRFAENSFTESYLTTIGVDFRFRTLTVGGKVVKLHIWDTAGQERFRTMTSAYYRGSDGIVLVYDTTDKDSFDHMDSWLQEVNRFAGDSTSKLLVGNKSDMTAERAVTSEEGQKKADSLKVLGYIETSAQSADKVDQAFGMIAAEMIKKAEKAATATAGIRQQSSTAPPAPGFSLAQTLADAPGAAALGSCCQ